MGDRDVRNKKAVKLILLHENVIRSKVKVLEEIWEKNFWKRMKGVQVTSINQSLFFSNVTPSEVYENLLNIGKFSRLVIQCLNNH